MGGNAAMPGSLSWDLSHLRLLCKLCICLFYRGRLPLKINGIQKGLLTTLHKCRRGLPSSSPWMDLADRSSTQGFIIKTAQRACTHP